MKVPLEPINIILLVFSWLIFVDGKGGSGGGGGGGRGGGGRSGGRGLSKNIRTGAVILGSGAAGYAAYKAHQNAKKDRDRGDKDSPDFDSFEQYTDSEGKFDYKLLESSSYYASEGIGMSAWALVFLILAIIALGTCGWYCCNVFLPVYQDNQQMRRRSMLGNRMKDEVPLQETPSTATPSP